MVIHVCKKIKGTRGGVPMLTKSPVEKEEAVGRGPAAGRKGERTKRSA